MEHERFGPPPWRIGHSIYDEISARIGLDGRLPKGVALPDESRVEAGSRFRWAPGACDGALGLHGEAPESSPLEEILRSLRRLFVDGDEGSSAGLYEVLRQHRTLTYVDALLERLAEGQRFLVEDLGALGRWLALKSPDREPVKAGIAILGLVARPEDLPVFMTLGSHDELTLYAATAIANAVPEPERMLWELAKRVDGWGRIHTVRRLGEAWNPEIRDWLLREGFRNEVMYEYLAFTCAMGGRLHEALAEETIDDSLFTASGEILSALIAGRGGPAEGIEEYPHAASAAEWFLSHAAGGARELDHFLSVCAVEDFLDEAQGWEARYEQGWSQALRRHLRDVTREILGRPSWGPVVEAGLESSDRAEFHRAIRVARRVGQDTWPEIHRRLLRGEDIWYEAVQTDDRDRMQTVVSLAETTLPLAEIASGPADELGLGPAFKSHGALDYLVQELGRFPGLGYRLIKTGLHSPVTGNRIRAARALASWPRDRWPEEAERVVRACMESEPSEKVRASFEKLLGGETEGT